MNTKTENSRMRVCAIARERHEFKTAQKEVCKDCAKVGRFARKVVRYFSIVPRFYSCRARVPWVLRLGLEQEEDGHGDHSEAQHVA